MSALLSNSVIAPTKTTTKTSTTMISENKKQYFIDLTCLAPSSFYKDKKVTLFFQNADANDHTLIHQMRKAVRKVGFSIMSIERRFKKAGNDMAQIEFHTDIPEDVWTESIRLYNNWVEDIGLDC